VSISIKKYNRLYLPLACWLMSCHISTSEHQTAYEYLLHEKNLLELINETFEFVLVESDTKEFCFCINPNLAEIDLADFNSIPDSIKQVDLKYVKGKNLPEGLLAQSNCIQKQALNVRFSRVASGILTAEVSARMLNFGGGVEFGPSLNILFVFNKDGKVDYYYERYTNG